MQPNLYAKRNRLHHADFTRPIRVFLFASLLFFVKGRQSRQATDDRSERWCSVEKPPCYCVSEWAALSQSSCSQNLAAVMTLREYHQCWTKPTDETFFFFSSHPKVKEIYRLDSTLCGNALHRRALAFACGYRWIPTISSSSPSPSPSSLSGHFSFHLLKPSRRANRAEYPVATTPRRQSCFTHSL